jgi:hypothetical protein
VAVVAEVIKEEVEEQADLELEPVLLFLLEV